MRQTTSYINFLKPNRPFLPVIHLQVIRKKKHDFKATWLWNFKTKIPR